ncbi:hypothetical protein D9613_012370 [Agrocybe pediades]|uniref:Uncharacterized protein n=1 Tax=Agrocybe pediades TaxID=84607 RepID=A0A8H4QT19_9AGAR|nr:hypothetical protein D9613_012370 [Agrocybe pediades]
MVNNKVALLIGILATTANLFVIYTCLSKAFLPAVDFTRAYSYMGHDFPDSLPIPSPGLLDVEVYLEESPRYSVKGLASDDEWLSLTSRLGGYIRLGPPKRLFMVTMFHELHCLRVINLAFEPTGWDNTPGPIDESHIKHCFDYLRQAVLCSADLNVEEGSYIQGEFWEKSFPQQRMCKDWTSVYRVMNGD